MSKTPHTYSLQFWLLCVSTVLFFGSFSMIIPELPDFLTQLGGAEYKGFIISLFTLTAMIARPFSGKLTDVIGRKPVIIIGSLVCLVCSALYPILTTVGGFLLLRLWHGFSTGFSPTGVAAYVTDVIPIHKRGEAMGWIGTAGALGMAGGPAIGGAVSIYFGIDAMFYLSSFFALISAVILLKIRESAPKKSTVTWRVLKVSKHDLIEPLVFSPAFVMLLTAYCYGAFLTILPDMGVFLGIKNKGVLFTFFTVSSLIVRLVAGKTSDLYGRQAVLKISLPLMFAAMLTLGLANVSWVLIAGVVLYGLAQGATSPTLLAWASDLCNDKHRGRGIAFFYILMELGIGAGALISSFIYANDSSMFLVTFIVCACTCALATCYLFLEKKIVSNTPTTTVLNLK